MAGCLELSVYISCVCLLLLWLVVYSSGFFISSQQRSGDGERNFDNWQVRLWFPYRFLFGWLLSSLFVWLIVVIALCLVGCCHRSLFGCLLSPLFVWLAVVTALCLVGCCHRSLFGWLLSSLFVWLAVVIALCLVVCCHRSLFG